MVERKKSDKEDKTVKIKATTGAWWKSKASDEPVEAPAEVKKDVKDASNAVKPKRAPRAKKATPAVKTPRKSTRTTTKKKVEETTDSTLAETESSPEALVPKARAPKKTTPRKTTAKPRTSRAKAKNPEKESLEVVAVDQAVSAEKEPEVVVPEEAKDTAPEKAKSPKPRRGRRPKAAPKKDTSTGQEEGVDEVDGNKAAKEQQLAEAKAVAEQKDIDGNVVETVATTETQDAEARKAKSPKPRRARKPRAAAKKKETTTDNVEGAVAEEIDGAETSADNEPVKAKATDQRSEAQKTSPKKIEEEPQEEIKKVSKLLINAEEPEECRLALLEDGRLESINVSTTVRTQRKNNIYKARIVAIEPSLQAAFVEYGTDKNGFLPFSEIHPEYFKQELSESIQHLVDTQQWKKLSITDVVERGTDILAQVVKEEVGKKGANMTTYLSIPGRCVVLMPGSDSSGISRKISGEQRRSQLRETMKSMELPEGIGWIVRTASVDITEEDLSRDVGYLVKLWDDIKGKGQRLEGVGLVYEEQHSVLRFLREHFDPSIQEILVDDRTALEQVKDFVQMLPKDQQNVTVRLHQGARPIFNQFSVEDQIESIYQPQVSLPSGGSIVIDPTEALVAIDVNSGSTSKGKNFEASIFQANMEAAVELARQLRLRDLGGLIVVDFIDMRSRKNIIAVEKQVRAAMKKDKAKVDFSRISKFGLMEISRQKLGAPIEAGNYRRCEHCKGRGSVRSIETLSLFYLRRVQTGASRKPVEKIDCHFPMDVAAYLLNKKRTEINEMEKRYNVEITIHAEASMKPSDNEIIFHKAEKDTNNKKQA
ncbi:Rne/Rng family ribonuclease [Desulforhopalus sp. 52FAK]